MIRNAALPEKSLLRYENLKLLSNRVYNYGMKTVLSFLLVLLLPIAKKEKKTSFPC
jgi:hypothetical protein